MTTIPDGYSPNTDSTTISTDGTHSVRVEVMHRRVSPAPVVAVLPRAEFIAAVETELDVIVIDRADLPGVQKLQYALRADLPRAAASVHPADTEKASDFRDLALCYLALAEHLEANPPIDTQVAALADIISDFAIGDEHTGTRDDMQLARLLIARGVTVKDPS